jgi:hypothetical protein
MSLEVFVAHSWAELGRPSLTSPTMEVMSFTEEGQLGSQGLASPSQIEQATGQELTILNVNIMALDSRIVTTSCNTSSSSMQEGMIPSSPTAFIKLVSGELPVVAL